MPTNWQLYDYLLGNGKEINQRQTNIDEAVSSFEEGIVNDPSYQEDATVNGEPKVLAVVRDSSKQGSVRTMAGDKLFIGDMVHVYDEDWIVVESYVDQVGLCYATIWLCNGIINFQNHSEPVHTRGIVIDDGSYSRSSRDPIAYVPDGGYKIYITLDDDTRKLYIDKRLAIEKIYSAELEEILEVYQIDWIDIRSKNFGTGSHLSVLTVQRGVYNPETDDAERMLCDVYHAPEEEDTPSEIGSCLISGRDNIRIGTSRTYAATFYNEINEEEDIEAVWTVTVPQDVTYTIEGNSCKVTVPLIYDLVGGKVTLFVTDSEGKYGTYEKKVEVITIG